MSIQIKTAIHEDIYKSQGGGQTLIAEEWSTGPRNLMKAADMLEDHKKAMDQAYGNIGHVASWIEIDGFRLRYETLHDLDRYLWEDKSDRPRKTRTEVAKEIIEDVRNGNLEKEYAQSEEMMAESWRRYLDQLENSEF